MHPAATASERPRSFGTWSSDQNVRKVRFFKRSGYEVVRYFFEMNRPNLDNIEVPPMPDGLEIRPIGSDRASLKQMWDADVEAFQDHWGGFDASEQSFHRWLDSPSLDLSLLVMAWDGDEVAAGVVNAIYPAENESLGTRRGWLDSVFTRRQWRKRGLAQALIVRSLHLLRERGMTTAALGVDAENPSGALRLYERNGFAVEMRGSAHRRPMEAEDR